ncbi:MAG TPA: HEPN domain-containing protein [Blastocatellia bacterium]|nr:HEPN domain-containing protein [Blastocatellia bacterium]
MKPTTLEWINKAEDDFHVAQMSFRARRHPSYDAAVFHSQQCAEKYLKARLEEGDVAFARTHDLLVLHQMTLVIEPSWTVLQELLIFLNPFAIAYRYPGNSATKLDAQDALKNCREVRRVIRKALGLSV